jgi:hypothetical protein
MKNKYLTLIKNNNFRKLASYLYTKYNLELIRDLNMYEIIHNTFIFLVSVVFIFSLNVVHLIILLIIVTLDAFSIIALHNCPLTILEKKYYKKSSNDKRDEFLKELGISYNCNHIYEKQIELLINVWLLVAGKCLLIMFFNMFNIHLNNNNQLYV